MGKSILGKKVHVGIEGAFQNEGQEFTCNWSPRCTAPKTAVQLLVTRKSGKSSTWSREDTGKRNGREKGRSISLSRQGSLLCGRKQGLREAAARDAYEGRVGEAEGESETCSTPNASPAALLLHFQRLIRANISSEFGPYAGTPGQGPRGKC